MLYGANVYTVHKILAIRGVLFFENGGGTPFCRRLSADKGVKIVPQWPPLPEKFLSLTVSRGCFILSTT